MATTYTPNTKIGKPAVSDTGWGPVLTAGSDTLDALAPVGGLAVTTHEQPSSSLLVDVAAGKFTDQAGGVQSYAGISSQAVTTLTTKTLYLDGTASWALVVGSSYPTTPHVRLATVVAGATTISSITDNRQSVNVSGSIAEGVNFVLGTATGTKFGTATSQKIGFFNHAPVIQPTMGSATAGGTYTSAEQAMLQAVYDAVRALGLGS